MLKLLESQNTGVTGDYKQSRGFQGMLVIYGNISGSTVTIEVSPDSGTTTLPINDQAGTAINTFTVAGGVSEFSIPATLQVRASISGGTGTGVSVELH